MTCDLRTLTFGVEIELTGIARQHAAQVVQTVVGGTVTYTGGSYDTWTCVAPDGRKWNASRDSSIVVTGEGSAEVVTPILTYADMDTLQQVVRALRAAGAKAHPSCGIHIHVGADQLKREPASLARLLKWWHKQEEIVLAMARTQAGRRDTFCRPMSEAVYARVDKWDGSLAGLAKVWYGTSNPSTSYHYDSSRYHALNLHSVWFRGTVEFRLFECTTHAGQVKAYVQLCLAIVAQAINASRARGARRLFVEARGKWDARIILRNLGMMGAEFASARKHLMDHLQGTSQCLPGGGWDQRNRQGRGAAEVA